jgi:retron-type reverse transcriptase
MKDSIWYIEGDIINYFDTIDHSVLMGLIARRIRDKAILKLIASGLKAKILSPKAVEGSPTLTPEVGTLQGGILSPLLSNIYLHELDTFMGKLAKEYQGATKASNRIKNPQANKLLRSGQKSLYYKMRIPSRIHNDLNYSNCKYVRYADDFFIGVIGSRAKAEEIRGRVHEFLRNVLKLELSLEKTKITHISKKIEFLGYLFSRRTLFVKQRYRGKIVTRKLTIPILDINMVKVIDRLNAAKFCDKSGNPEPAFRFLRLPQADTNVKANRILKGLSNW